MLRRFSEREIAAFGLGVFVDGNTLAHNRDVTVGG